MTTEFKEVRINNHIFSFGEDGYALFAEVETCRLPEDQDQIPFIELETIEKNEEIFNKLLSLELKYDNIFDFIIFPLELNTLK
jgi:hypothetical protein